MTDKQQAIKALNDYRTAHPGATVANDNELMRLFLAYVEHNPDLQAETRELLALPEAKALDEDGRPLYSVDQAAEYFNLSREEVIRKAAIEAENTGVEVWHSGEVHLKN